MATLSGTAKADILGGTNLADGGDGGGGADTLLGRGGDDSLGGGGGGDLINGAAGDDALYGYGGADLDPLSGAIRVDEVASGLDTPLFAASPPGDPDRLFIVEQHTGQVRILDLSSGQLAATPFLDLDDADLAPGREQGLLGLAFHPDYASNGKLYVHLTNADGDIEIREYVAGGDAVDPASARLLLTIPHPDYANHNGGWMAFGPDGYLHIAIGDGGGPYDVGNDAQSLDSLLGKVLRLDVDHQDPGLAYAIPDDNPFAGGADGARPEIYDFGLRNPWRGSFDRATGDFYLADVGAADWEELNYVPAGANGGLNFGWVVKEGTHPARPDIPGNPPFDDPSLYDPVLELPHGTGPGTATSITGGYVYRGPGGGQGSYFFADFRSGNLFTVQMVEGEPVDFAQRNGQLRGDLPFSLIASFAEDGSGRLYAITLDGRVLRLTPGEAAADGADTLNGGDGADRLFGGAGGDRLVGATGADSLHGGIEGDLLWGGADNDSLDGGEDADTLAGDAGDDVLDGGAGLDVASYGAAPGAVTVSLTELRPQETGAAGLDTLLDLEGLIGSRFADKLGGAGGGETLMGMGGADTLEGAAGDDRLDGGAGADAASYASAGAGVVVSLALTGPQNTRGAGWDTLASIESLTGSMFADRLTGSDLNNRLEGGAGMDSLVGGAGADRIDGGADRDVLTGGSGLDTFVFAELQPLSARDVITDLETRDVLDLSAIDADIGTAGDQAFMLVQAFTGRAGEIVLVYNSVTARTDLRMDVDGDGGADGAISLNGDHASFSNFVL